jgi:SAM-dependent methyltransferase
LAEFTGERVIPGLVEPSLWDEHVSRYSFATALAAGKRVLDVGCGTGYGAATLAEMAAYTFGFDISPEAVDYATLHYGQKAKFVVGSAENFPTEIGCFDLITAFEVIEHLTDWPRLLSEVNRVLAEDGLFLVSTPNKTYYGEARQREGPNPFHIHEFEYKEFREALEARFPYVRILAQNRVEAFSFFDDKSPASGTARFAEAAPDVSDAHFYIAICGRHPIPALSHVYVPNEGNLLRERERHIQLLQQELKTLCSERDVAATQLAQFESDLEARDKWIDALKQQILDQQREREVAAGQLAQFESDLEARDKWIDALKQQILDHQRERDAALAALQTGEHELEQRTNWANQLQRELTERTEWAQRLDQELSEIGAKLGDRESVIAELTGEVTRGRNELGLLLAAMRAQSAATDDHGREIEAGRSPSLPHDELAELRELVVELEKLRVSQARLFESQMARRSELQRRLDTLTQERGLAAKSRWLKLGRALGLGPRLD